MSDQDFDEIHVETDTIKVQESPEISVVRLTKRTAGVPEVSYTISGSYSNVTLSKKEVESVISAVMQLL